MECIATCLAAHVIYHTGTCSVELRCVDRESRALLGKERRSADCEAFGVVCAS